MDKVKMRVAVRTGTKLSAHGCDTVTFEISVNPGEPEKPLSKGGLRRRAEPNWRLRLKTY